MKRNSLYVIMAFCLGACGSETVSDENLLLNIRTTERISSNHYSDFVLDEAGNTYIASFQKQEGAFDRILILKLSPSGKVLWEIGKEDLGRALAITRNVEGELWVTGRFRNKLSWNGQTLEAPDRSSMFLARINDSGVCTKLIKPQGTPLAFNIHANTSGSFLIGGIIGKEGGFEKVQAKSSEKETCFLALFDKEGKCQWIKRLRGNIQRIHCDPEGNFYVGGDFVETFAFEQERSFTSGPFDQDGFLLKIGKKESWSKTFGHKGSMKYGYRSYEGVSDISIQDKDKIHIILRKDNPAYIDANQLGEDLYPTDLFLLSLNSQGEILDSQRVVKHVQRGHVFRMTQDNLNRIWIAGTAKGSFEIGTEAHTSPVNQSFLIRLDSTQMPDKILLPEHGPNMLFRVANRWKDRVVLTGHYQSHLYIGQDSLENKGKHGMFLFRTKGQ